MMMDLFPNMYLLTAFIIYIKNIIIKEVYIENKVLLSLILNYLCILLNLLEEI